MSDPQTKPADDTAQTVIVEIGRMMTAQRQFDMAAALNPDGLAVDAVTPARRGRS